MGGSSDIEGARRREVLGGLTGAAAGSGAHAAPSARAGKASPSRRGSRAAALTDLRGQVAVVADNAFLGSPQVARLLADAGAAVVLLSPDGGEARALIEELTGAGARAMLVPADVEREADVVQAFAAVQRAFGRLDILVNTQGVVASLPLTETSADLFDRLYSVNLRSVFLCMREAVKAMVAAGNGGRIVNITTVGAMNPVLHGNSAYSPSRAGVTMLTKTTALDYAQHGIRVNVLMPGAGNKVLRIDTGTKVDGPVMEGPHRMPLGPGNMDQIAAAALFLCSRASDYVTGGSLTIDGGFLLT